MMMKVALLLLALAAPMISAFGCSKARSIITDSKKCPACKQVKKLIREVSADNEECQIPKPCSCKKLGLVEGGLNSDLLDCCPKCPKKKCKKCPPKKKSGYGGYGGGGGLYGYGHDNKGRSYCAPRGDYGYGDWNNEHDTCENYEPAYNYGNDKYIVHDKEKGYLCGYGEHYRDCNLCTAQKPDLYVEYLYAVERCGPGYAPPPVYEPKCPENKCTYDVSTCKYDEKCGDYNTCPACPACPYGANDAALASSGETTNETVQTLSWVLIAIAAALFLASISFCAVGRRERKAHAAENVHVNALA